MKHTRIIGRKVMTVTLALACVALVAAQPQWRDELQAQEYDTDYFDDISTGAELQALGTCGNVVGDPTRQCSYRNSHSSALCETAGPGKTRYDLICGLSGCDRFKCK